MGHAMEKCIEQVETLLARGTEHFLDLSPWNKCGQALYVYRDVDEEK